ncbi:MAG: glycosyltransferase family 2 protein [Candidatus Wallbacteria bacterium]|nr:glycosyltransferase family 2 protein [Candidatus Wallbacteria bacterium]
MPYTKAGTGRCRRRTFISSPATPESTTQRPRLSVVIPCYNEERRLGPTLDTIAEFLRSKPYSWELVVVDDGSADATIAVAQARRAAGAPVRIFSYGTNRGKGHAVRTGMLTGSGELLLLCDADLSTPIGELDRLMARIDEGFDVAIGSRRAAGHHVKVPQPFYRVFLGRIHSWLCHQFLVPHVQDFTCGFKLFKRHVCQDIIPRAIQDRWTYDPELVYLAHASGYKIAEVPVEWSNDPATRVRLLQDVLGSLRGLAAIYTNHRLGLFLPEGGSSRNEPSREL